MVVTGGREYSPGDVLPVDISAVDLTFLREKGFVEPVDMTPDGARPSAGCGQMDEEDTFTGFDEREPGAIKSPEEIRKIRSKKEICSYALSIGLDLGEGADEKGLKELHEEVINFQEEELAEDDIEGD